MKETGQGFSLFTYSTSAANRIFVQQPKNCANGKSHWVLSSNGNLFTLYMKMWFTCDIRLTNTEMQQMRKQRKMLLLHFPTVYLKC